MKLFLLIFLISIVSINSIGKYQLKGNDDCKSFKFLESIMIEHIDSIITFYGKIKINYNEDESKSEIKTFKAETCREVPEITLFDNEDLSFNIYEPYSYQNLILVSKRSPECVFHLKRQDEETSGYDIGIEFPDRKDGLENGIEIKYKNRKAYEKTLKESFTYYFIEGEKKIGKTFITSLLGNATMIINPDYTINTNGLALVIAKKAVIVDSEGLDTPLIPKKFFNISKSEDELDEEKIEVEKNKLFREIIRNSFRDVCQVLILVVNQNTIHIKDYIQNFVKRMKNSNIEQKFIVIHNFKELDEKDVRERVHKDLLSTKDLKEIQLSEQPPVNAYIDENFEGTEIKLTHLIILNKATANLQNQITMRYLTDFSREMSKRFNSIEKFVNNINENFKLKIDDDIDDSLKCAEIQKVDEKTDVIKFINKDKCNIWENVLDFTQNYNYELYMKNNLLYFDIFIPGLCSKNDIESLYVEVKHNDRNNYILQIEIKLKNFVSERSDAPLVFTRVKRRNQINIKHAFIYRSKKGWNFLTDFETFIKGGILSIMIPYSFY